MTGVQTCALPILELSDEVINRKIPYCDKVRILNNPHNFVSNDFDKEADKIEPMVYFFGDKTIENFTLCTYISYITLGNRIFKKRLQFMREYNLGNKDVIENFIESVEFKNIF